MATNVFPQADDTVTVGAWSAMIAALDRGTVDTLPNAPTPETVVETDRILFDYDYSKSIGNDTSQEVVSVDIDEGHCYAGTFNCEVANDASNDENLLLAFTVPTGVRAYIYGLRRQNFASNSVVSYAYEKTAVTDDNIMSISFSSFSGEAQSLRLTLVLFGESAGGTTEIRMAKTGNGYPAEAYDVTNSWLSLRRIW